MRQGLGRTTFTRELKTEAELAVPGSPQISAGVVTVPFPVRKK